MSGFSDREKAQENKYAFERESEFKVVARRNKLLGMWAAEQMHYDGEKAKDYAKTVVLSDFEEPGDEDVFRKIRSDFDNAGLSVPDEVIRDRMADLLDEARQQIAAEG